jgi:hypothetical protein
MFGLAGEKYPYVQAVVTVFLFLEAYFILPKWNRRIEDRNIPRDGNVLHLE